MDCVKLVWLFKFLMLKVEFNIFFLEKLGDLFENGFFSIVCGEFFLVLYFEFCLEMLNF